VQLGSEFRLRINLLLLGVNLDKQYLAPEPLSCPCAETRSAKLGTMCKGTQVNAQARGLYLSRLTRRTQPVLPHALCNLATNFRL
jgi:hypothetical protein